MLEVACRDGAEEYKTKNSCKRRNRKGGSTKVLGMKSQGQTRGNHKSVSDNKGEVT